MKKITIKEIVGILLIIGAITLAILDIFGWFVFLIIGSLFFVKNQIWEH